MVHAWKLLFTICTICIVHSHGRIASQSQSARIRFPGPANVKKLPKSVLQRQVAAPAEAPYPPAGLKPDTPFELPTETAADFPAPELTNTYGPPALPDLPDQTYGPPDQTYGPPEPEPEIPDQTYGPPEPAPEVPDQTYGPPDQTYGPPDQTYGPPEPAPELPDQTYGPPEVTASSNNLPQSASILNADIFLPQTQLTPPASARPINFRPIRPARIVRLPNRSRRPAKLIVNGPLRPRPRPRPHPRPLQTIGIPVPQTQLTLPFPERLQTFRPAKFFVGRPSKPNKLIVGKLPNTAIVPPSETLAQLTPSIKIPIFSGEIIIGYSDRPQNWLK